MPATCRLAAVALLSLLLTSWSADGQSAPAEGAPDWRAQAKQNGLLPLEIESLERDGMVVIGQTVDPDRVYQRDGGTIFVTSDTMIATFSALLRAGFIEVEHANAEYLRRAFAQMWEQLAADCDEDERTQLSGAAREGVVAAKVLLATTLDLLGDPIERVDKATSEGVKAELSLIRAGRPAARTPALALVDRDSPIPYHQCSPRGDYQRDSVLRGYFQAVSWLHLTGIPLETAQGRACGVALARALARSESALRELVRIDSYIESVIGTGAIECGPSRFGEALDPDGLVLSGSLSAAIRRVETLATAPARGGPKRRAEWKPRVLRFFRPVMVPSTSIFRALESAGVKPSGLQLAAVLGSEFARQTTPAVPGEFASKIDTAAREGMRSGESIHSRSLQCLSVLLKFEDRRLPPFMQTERWRAKTCSTALSGWAWQMYLSGLWVDVGSVAAKPEGKPVGFVEPNPRFFRSLREVALRASRLLARNREEATALLNHEHASPSWKRITGRSARLAKRFDLPGHWAWLISSLDHFERIASNQLKGRRMSKADVDVIREFGRGFERALGCAILFTRRPLACASGVYREHESIMHAAVSPARPIWVLYPRDSQVVLCQGVVWLYHEFRESRAVSDKEWRMRVWSSPRRDLPAWLRGFVRNR